MSPSQGNRSVGKVTGPKENYSAQDKIQGCLESILKYLRKKTDEANTTYVNNCSIQMENMHIHYISFSTFLYI